MGCPQDNRLHFRCFSWEKSLMQMAASMSGRGVSLNSWLISLGVEEALSILPKDVSDSVLARYGVELDELGRIVPIKRGENSD